MFEILSYDFIQNALIGGILISIISGIIGVLIVINRMVFLTGGIAHSSYGGIGLSIFFGIPIFLGTSIFTIILALFIAYIIINFKDRVDTFIGIIWAVGMAIGIILIDMTDGYQGDLIGYLFGSILAVSENDINFIFYLLIIITLFVTIFYKDILAVSYDKQYARLRNININFFYTLILVLRSLAIVVAIKIVGLILVIALLTIPVYIAQSLSSSLSSMMIISSILSSIFTIIGLMLSYTYDLTSGATIILVSACCLIIFTFAKYIYLRITKI